MKKKLAGILFGALLFGFATNLSAEESGFFAYPNLYNYELNSGIRFFSTETAGLNISPGAAGWLNLLFGLGSFLMGDPVGGLSLLALHGAGWGVIIYGVATGNADTDYGYTLGAIAGTFLGIGIIWGFVRPHLFQNRIDANRTARLDDLRNWDIALVPNGHGNLRGQIAFTAHF